MASTTSAPASSLTSETTTFAPSAASRSAMARPMPAPDPVTSAVLFVKIMVVSIR